MTPEILAQKLRAFLIRAEKGTALLLNYEFDELQKEITEHLRSGGRSINDLDDILHEIEQRLARRTVRMASAVRNAQKRVIGETAGVLPKYAELEASIFAPDAPAVKELTEGGSLTRLFGRLGPAMSQAASNALIEGFSLGESAAAIARRISDIVGFGRFRSMTIARTETVQAHRSATREFYRQAGIKKYVWMSILDPRVCAICWSLHGTVWPSRKKVYGHANCRCVLVAVLPGMKPVETGAARFGKLESGFQKQILGPSRFELYKNGMGLGDFLGVEETKEYGAKHFIRPLADLTAS